MELEEPGSKSNPYESPRRGGPCGSAQITGRPCAVCDKPIVTSINASWCPACELAFHAHCLGGRTRCTKCRRDFKESEAAVNSQAARQSAAEIQLGR
jgi:hypothetical protein